MPPTAVPASLARRVRERARDRCEYCGLNQTLQEATFHIDHVTPRRAGGPTTFANLALACVSCSLRKGAREHALDPESGAMVRLFNPRADGWEHHLRLRDDMVLEGRTAEGRATIEALQLNRAMAVGIRREAARLSRSD